MNTSLKHLKSNHGFTLLEALFAIGLCSLAIMALAGSFNHALNINAYSKSRLIALAEARKVAEHVRTVANTGLSNIATTDFSTLLSNPTPLPSETVSVNTSGSDPLTVTVQVSWLEKGRAANTQLVTTVTQR